MIDLINYGFHKTMIPNNAIGIPARIMAVFKERYEIICEHGLTYAKLKVSVYYGGSGENFPTTGDFVLIQYNNSGDSLILKTLDRKSKFARNDFSGHRAEYVKTVLEQVVAANFDYVFIMASLNYDFNVRRMERYLTLVYQSGAVPVIILTKADLLEDFSEQVHEVQNIAKGVAVIAVSAKTGYGLDEVTKFLKPRKTIVFLGSSGVGKSSLVNALAGEDIMLVNDIREDDSRGHHTTTHRQLIMLKNGVMVIDTPGMRELGMWEVSLGLEEAFADVKAVLGHCKFSDCKHQSEPDCAVKKAITNGELSIERWNSYLRLKREAKFSDDKAGLLKNKQQWSKPVSKFSKQNKKRKDMINENKGKA